jgi:hypothetical protein
MASPNNWPSRWTPQREHGDGDWVETARNLAVAILAVARAHPGAFELVGLRALNTSEALRSIATFLEDLRIGGFPPDRAVAVYRLLLSYARGFALVEITGFTSPAANDCTHETAKLLSSEGSAAIRELSEEPTDAHFLAGLETILAGLQQELQTKRP